MLKLGVGARAFVGAAGGGAFAWLLQHLPPAISWVLAVAATVAVGRLLWTFHRFIRQDEQQHAEFMAAIERVRQGWRAGSN